MRGIGGISTAISGISTAVSGLGGIKGIFTALTGPVGLTVTAIMGLVAAFSYLMATNDGFRESVMTTISTIMSSLQPILQTLMGLLMEIGGIIFETIGSVLQQLAPVLAQIITFIGELVAMDRSAHKPTSNGARSCNYADFFCGFPGCKFPHAAADGGSGINHGCDSSAHASYSKNTYRCYRRCLKNHRRSFPYYFYGWKYYQQSGGNYLPDCRGHSGHYSENRRIYFSSDRCFRHYFWSYFRRRRGCFWSYLGRNQRSVQWNESAWNGLTGFVGGIVNGIGSAFNALVDGVKAVINGVISAINGAIWVINLIPGVNIGEIPYLAHGTDNWQGGFAYVNEGGRGELTYLPNGSQVIPHDISVQYAKEAARANASAEPVDLTGILEGLVIQIVNNTTVDGTPLKEMAAEYTIKRIGGQQRAVQRARGFA